MKSVSPVIAIVSRIMFRRCFAGCINLPCIRKKGPVDEEEEEDFPVKDELHKLTSQDLSRFTAQFSPENLVGVTNLGKLYRGKMVIDDISKDVAVKIIGIDKWIFRYTGDDRLERFEYELKFLQAPRIKGNPNLVKVIGYCEEEETLGIVYDLNPHDILENLITRADFNWMLRVRTALTLARLLNYLHDRKYLIRNFAPYHIVLDQDFTPIMFELGLIVGGVLGNTINESDMRCAPYGYIDSYIFQCGTDTFSVKSDVFAFGVLLLNFISKKVVEKGNPVDNEVLDLWALKEFKPGCSLVHQSFVGDPGFGHLDAVAITELAKRCVEDRPKKRPNMKEVVACLENLHVV